MFAPFLNTKSVAHAMVEFGLSQGHARASRARAAPHVVTAAESDRWFEPAELSLEQMDAAQSEWADLAARAIEPNAFFEPGFALSAARHFPAKARPRFIVVWGRSGRGEKRMDGVFPIMTPSPLVGDGFIRLWLHKQAALATPLVDGDRAVATIEAFLDWIEARSYAAGVVFSRMTMNGRFHAALMEALRRAGRRPEILEAHRRAALLPGRDADDLCQRAGTKKKLLELQRMRRRLEEIGRVDFVVSAEPAAVRSAAEEFLALEASGWKAGRGAFLSEPALTTFMRSATRLLAQAGRCRVYALRLDGRPIAMAIVVESQGRSYWWKIAFDEAYRSQAPGMQLAHELTKAQLARRGVEMTDSCAIPNHPMIDRHWPDRVAVGDLAVQLQTGREREFLASCRKDRRRRGLRAFAKRTANGLLKRRAN